MKEIVTLQVGGYANFVGSHFWNLQDELLGLESDPEAEPVFANTGIDFDVLYRVGESRQGIATYTPRLLAIDARGSLGAVRAAGSLYDQASIDETSIRSSWKGKISKHTADPVPKNEFLRSLEDEEVENEQAGLGVPPSSTGHQDLKKITRSRLEENIIQDLEENVSFWTDYSKVHFHPSSLYEIEGLWHGISPFDDFGSGRGILTGSSKEDIHDRLRLLIEESDHMQGLQTIVDDSNGFAGLSLDILESIVDEYDKTPVMIFTVRPPSSFIKPRSKYAFTVRELHDAITFSELTGLNQCMIPMGIPSFLKGELSRFLQINEGKSFHTSAIYGAAFSCITLPLRMKASQQSVPRVGLGSIDMGSLIYLLSGQTGRQVSVMDMALPGHIIPDVKGRTSYDFSRFQRLTSDAGTPDNAADSSEALVLQGAPMEGSDKYGTIEELVNGLNWQHEAGKGFRSTHHHLSASLCPMAVPLPFPRIFGPLIGQRGQILKNELRTGSSVWSVPVAARLCASPAVLPHMESRLHSLQDLSSGSSRSMGTQVLEGWGIQKDELRELREGLTKTVAAYGGDTDFAASSDSD